MNWAEGVPNRGYWDQGRLELMFEMGFDQRDRLEDLDGAVVVLPAGYHADKVELVNEKLASLKWVVLMLTSDEESTFPWRELDHPNMKLWVQTPHPTKHADCDATFFGEGYQMDCPGTLRRVQLPYGVERPLDWYFSGQVTHARREECVEAARYIPNGLLNETAGFTQGFEYSEYLRRMASARVALAPSGPATPCSFRLHEALEAGCVPIVDASSPGHPSGYWDMVYPDRPFPVLESWSELPVVMAEVLADWSALSGECRTWWQHKKAQQLLLIDEQVHELGG